MKYYIKLLCLLYVFSIQSCETQTNKINGLSFVASREAINKNHVDPLLAMNANYAAIMPFGFLKDLNHPNIVYNSERQWFGETKAGAKQYIETLRKLRVKIMLKPQIWVWRGEFTGFITMKTDEDWKVFEQSYETFILDYAKLAEDLNVELFCVGTELETFVDKRPEYWENLIAKIKEVYSGKLTYAANWNEFNKTPFWKQLDFIGVDAYFPVSGSKTPALDECLKRWERYKLLIHENALRYDKQVLFTEYGYRSVDYAGKEPWKSDRSMNVVNLEAQVNTTQALFETFWNEDWFAGGFVWKWFHDHKNAGGEDDSRFTPQNKPVEAIIRNQYNLK